MVLLNNHQNYRFTSPSIASSSENGVRRKSLSEIETSFEQCPWLHCLNAMRLDYCQVDSWYYLENARYRKIYCLDNPMQTHLWLYWQTIEPIVYLVFCNAVSPSRKREQNKNSHPSSLGNSFIIGSQMISSTWNTDVSMLKRWFRTNCGSFFKDFHPLRKCLSQSYTRVSSS